MYRNQLGKKKMWKRHWKKNMSKKKETKWIQKKVLLTIGVLENRIPISGTVKV